jgi:hypothetical protein
LRKWTVKRQTDIDFDREFVKVHRVKAGLDAARKKNTIAVGEMMNPLRQATSRRNPRSPAFAEPAIIDLAKIMSEMTLKKPILVPTLFSTIGDMLQKLEKFPDLGGYCKYLGTREIELSEQPVTLVYTLGDHTAITVVACFYMDDVLD